MDVQSLGIILHATLSHNQDERKAAEQSLNQIKFTAQHAVRVLEIIVFDGKYDTSVRHVACIHFKNFITKFWSPLPPEEQSKIPMPDKDFVRNNILVFFSQLPPLMRVQLGDCLKTMINTDYPERWPGLLNWVKLNLQQHHHTNVYTALFVLRILARKYEFKSDDERLPVHLIVEETFPPLLNIFNKLVQIPNPALDVAELLKLICKIFWSSVYLEIPKQLFEPSLFNAWMVLFSNILERPVPVEGQPADPEEKKSWDWWKVKKWTVHILTRLYTRSRDMRLQNPESRTFAQMFEKSYAGKILELHLYLINVIHTGGYLPDRVINLILQYLSYSISKSRTYQILKPHLDVLLFQVIFPLLCFNDNDQMLWDEDPHEYIRKGYDTIVDLYSPRTAAMDFVSELVRKRREENLQKFIQFVVEILKRYDETPVEHKPYREKDGALFVIGALCDDLKKAAPYKAELEHMLVQHVFSEFNSPAGHLRAKAAWVAGQYAQINFSDQNNFCRALHSVVAGLHDPELPVRVDSVFALRLFVEACKDLGEMRPIIPQLLDEIFKIMNEIDNEDLVSTLEAIVDKCGEEMAPYAFGLCQNLAAAFWKCMSTAEADEEGNGPGGALAAVGCLRAISTILDSVSRLPHLFAQIEPTLLPITRRMLTIEGQDVLEEVLDIVSYMTFFSPISLELWSLWPLMTEALSDWAINFFSNILVILNNYISHSTTHFLTCKNPDYQQNLWKMISSIMADKNIEDAKIEPAPKLIEVVFQNCRGQTDHWVEPYLRITIERLQRTEKTYLRCLLVQVIANALYYNPTLTLRILHELGVCAEIFNLWFEMIHQVNKSGVRANFRRERDKKVCCLGLTSMLSLSADQLPMVDLGRIVRVTLELLIEYKDQVTDDYSCVAEAAEEDVAEDIDDMDDLQFDDEDDGDSLDDIDSNHLNHRAAWAKAFRLDDLVDFSSDDDCSDDEEFQTPIDEVDPFILFVDAVSVMKASDPLRFQNLTQSLEFHYQELANLVAQHADQRRLEIEKERRKKTAAAPP